MLMPGRSYEDVYRRFRGKFPIPTNIGYNVCGRHARAPTSGR